MAPSALETALIRALLWSAVLLAGSGCGTTLSQSATEQLLLSDAVDQSVSKIDFRILAGEKVYLDTQYVKHVKELGFVNADYIISSTRQQLAAAECLLQDKAEDAAFIVEIRVGALGTNSNEVTYGLPQTTTLSTAINTASSVVPTMPAVPPLPELAVAKKSSQLAAAKIAVFAYDRETREPVWQSGTSKSTSFARSTWLLGAGPIQKGTIYDGTWFAGARLKLPLPWRKKESPVDPPVSYSRPHTFPRAVAEIDTVDAEPPEAAADDGAGESPQEVAADPEGPAGEVDATIDAPSPPSADAHAPPDDDHQKLLWMGPEIFIAPAEQKQAP